MNPRMYFSTAILGFLVGLSTGLKLNRSSMVSSKQADTAGLNLSISSMASPQPTDKVEVRLLMEPGCHACHVYMTGPVKVAIADAEIAERMDLDVNTFGNLYFNIPECAHFHLNDVQYNPLARACWSRYCAAETPAQDRAQDCLDGELVVQLGKKQAHSTAYFMCAKQITESIWQKYVPFYVCMEDNYEEMVDPTSMDQWAKQCAQDNKLDWSKLLACRTEGIPSEMLKKEALKTPGHDGVPMLWMNGVEYQVSSDPQSLIYAIRQVDGGFLLDQAPRSSTGNWQNTSIKITY